MGAFARAQITAGGNFARTGFGRPANILMPV
jgi:hypothetical protein